jgi:hypothetical protein
MGSTRHFAGVFLVGALAATGQAFGRFPKRGRAAQTKAPTSCAPTSSSSLMTSPPGASTQRSRRVG